MDQKSSRFGCFLCSGSLSPSSPPPQPEIKVLAAQGVSYLESLKENPLPGSFTLLKFRIKTAVTGFFLAAQWGMLSVTRDHLHSLVGSPFTFQASKGRWSPSQATMAHVPSSSDFKDPGDYNGPIGTIRIIFLFQGCLVSELNSSCKVPFGM